MKRLALFTSFIVIACGALAQAPDKACLAARDKARCETEYQARAAARQKAVAACAQVANAGERSVCIRDALPPMDCSVEESRKAEELCERTNAVQAGCKGKGGQAFVDCAKGIGMARR